MVAKWSLRYSSPGIGRLPSHCTSLATIYGITLDGNEDDGGEQSFSKVHGSRQGKFSGYVLVSCRRANRAQPPPVNFSQIFSNITPCLQTSSYLSYIRLWVSILCIPNCAGKVFPLLTGSQACTSRRPVHRRLRCAYEICWWISLLVVNVWNKVVTIHRSQ